MPIYTRTGDAGTTGLYGGSRVSKNDERVAAYGDVDELNAALGAARAALGASAKQLDAAIGRVQEECFALGSVLASPPEKLGKLSALFTAGTPRDAAARLEREMDDWDKKLKPLKSFILPGGGSAGAALHVARAVARRAERAIVALHRREPLPDGVLVYFNRLSTWLFVAARAANQIARRTETPWVGLKK